VHLRFKTVFCALAAPSILLLTVSFLAGQTAPQVVASAPKCELSSSEVSVPLKQQLPGSFAKQLESIRANHRLYLRLSRLQALRPPGVLYTVYLEPAGTTTRADASRVGYINFFSVSTGAKGTPFSFEVTELIHSLLIAKPDLSGLQVRIASNGPPESTPSIGSIDLIAN
jgi:hypothetical protein